MNAKQKPAMGNRLADEIKESLTIERVARYYGFEPNRSGFIKCPFHDGDHTASLKLYPGKGGWYCFGCHRHGSVIDFVMQLYNISFTQAILRLNFDFNLGLAYDKPNPATQNAIIESRKREAQQKAEQERKWEEYKRLAAEFLYYWECIKYFAPTSPDFIHPLYAEAAKKIDYLDYLTENFYVDSQE